jgi:hypothetical protein
MRVLRLAFPLLAALGVAALGVAALGSARLHAANVKHMTLPELVANADRIVRGTVIAEDDTAVSAGGGQVPATLYRIRVAETLKGSTAGGEVIEVRLLAQPKTTTAGSTRRGTLFQDLPDFNVGQEYLFMLTRPSAVGLSTTVGLRQGLFELRGRGTEQLAVNGANNVGLLGQPAPGPQARSVAPARPANSGPIPYAALASEIRALVGR